MKVMGLKAKTLLTLSALLIVVISCNLLFTNYLIVEDKKAYIFENILSNAEEVRKIIDENIQNSLFQAESLGLLAEANHKDWKELLDKQEVIDGFYMRGGNQETKTSVMRSKFPKKNDRYPEVVSNWLRDTKELEQFGLSVKKIPGQNVFEVKLKDNFKSMGLLVDMETMWSRISGDVIFNYVILDSKGKILWKTGTDVSPELYSDLIKSTGASLSKEVTVDGANYLISVSSIANLGLHVVSYIPSAKAFAVVGDLSVKTIAFGLVLLGLSLVVGLLFSTKLTGPISALVDGVLHVAQGNFSYKVVVKTKDELFILAEKFNFMSSKISGLIGEKEVIIDELREANAQIEDYSKNLEKKVEERTRELKSANDFIQAMINSLDQGLFVFGPDLISSPIYTKACEDLFRKSPAGLSFADVLSLSDEEKARIPKWSSILFGEKIPFESAAQLGILEKTYGESIESDDYSVLKLHYHPMRDEDNSISNVVVVATDKTDEMRAIQETKKKERYVEMIFKILGAKRQFIDFIAEVDDYLKSLDEVLNAANPPLDTGMLIYHSFTGGFGMYAVDILVDEVRRCEQTIVEMKRAGKVNKEILLKQKTDFQENYLRFKEEIFTTLAFNTNTVEIEQATILYLNDLVQQIDNRELKHIFNEKIMKVPVEDYFTSYKNLLPTLALKLGKEIAPLKINNGDIRVSPDKFREFFALLVHLFRNCADHGIEAPHIREEKEKTLEGHIVVDVALENGGKKLRLVIEDDGAGIDPARIRKKLLESHPENSALKNESDEQIIYHIFDQDFSTAEQVTTISGRGVGMSAIKEIVERMHGQIKLDSKVGRGTKFIFELPVS